MNVGAMRPYAIVLILGFVLAFIAFQARTGIECDVYISPVVQQMTLDAAVSTSVTTGASFVGNDQSQ